MLVGRNKHGILVSINDVDSSEEIRCPECDEVLVQKRGDVRIHHFAHKSGNVCSNTGMTWQHMAIQNFLERFFSYTGVFESQLEKRISWRDSEVISDYYVEYDVCEQWHMKLSFEVVEAHDNYSHYLKKSEKYYCMDQQVVWVFDEEKLRRKIKGTNIKLNAMQEAIMRETGQIISVSSMYLDGFYIRKLYFPKGRWRKQTCKIYSTMFVKYVEDLKVIPTMSRTALLIKDGEDIMDNINDYYNVWWSNKVDKSDEWEEIEEYSNTFVRSEVKGVVAENYIYPQKLLVFDEAEERIASIPKNQLYKGLKYGDTVRIISKGNGMVDVEKDGIVKQAHGPSKNYGELLAKFKTDTPATDEVDVIEQENLDSFYAEQQQDYNVADEPEPRVEDTAEKELVDFLTSKYESLCKEAEYYRKILENMGGL